MSACKHIVRPAANADIPALSAMQERSMWVLGAGYYAPEVIAAFMSEIGTMDEAVVAEGHYFIACDRRGAFLGSGGWSQLVPGYARNAPKGALAPNTATVRSVFVDAAAARQGVGTAIMDRVEADARLHGMTLLRLAATLSGVPFYRALGYCPRGRRHFMLSTGARFECLEMEKPLASLRAAV